MLGCALRQLLHLASLQQEEAASGQVGAVLGLVVLSCPAGVALDLKLPQFSIHSLG